ncbi:unnamed protein product [Lymnaea stagnalis]|uniref:Uncharacterized protein n=1 Tax=Lymnaea stagnalis TaxID=6523 RepID=A0AAV2H2Q1_LYMST
MATKAARTDSKTIDAGSRMSWEVLETCAAVQSRSVAKGGPPRPASQAEDVSKTIAVRSKTRVKSDHPTLRIRPNLLNLPLTDTRLMERLQRARLFRDSLGPYEAEVICGPESDLHKTYDDCKKNPDHAHFKPVRAFTFGDMPLPYRNPGLYRLLQILAFLTVRVSVATVSDKRKGTQNEVFKKVESCNRFLRYGTGRVSGVQVFNTRQGKHCACPECLQSDAPQMTWGFVDVITAKHVVFYQDEARATTCRWGYDGDDSAEINLIGFKAKFSVNETDDWCKLRCVSHDVKLLSKLEKNLTKYNSSALELYDSWRMSKKKSPPKFIAIVSHPHGCPKQISFGFLRKRVNVGGVDLKYIYTAATCHGSSGASVFLLGRDGRNGLYNQIHSGMNKDESEKVTPNYGNFSVAVSH